MAETAEYEGDASFPGAPGIPNFDPMSLVGHVVYGVIVGALFPVIRNR